MHSTCLLSNRGLVYQTWFRLSHMEFSRCEKGAVDPIDNVAGWHVSWREIDYRFFDGGGEWILVDISYVRTGSAMGCWGHRCLASEDGRDGKVVGTEVIAYRPLRPAWPGIADSRSVRCIVVACAHVRTCGVSSLRMLAFWEIIQTSANSPRLSAG